MTNTDPKIKSFSKDSSFEMVEPHELINHDETFQQRNNVTKHNYIYKGDQPRRMIRKEETPFKFNNKPHFTGNQLKH